MSHDKVHSGLLTMTNLLLLGILLTLLFKKNATLVEYDIPQAVIGAATYRSPQDVLGRISSGVAHAP